MLNYFYMYAAVWGGILLVYSFGWSDLCTPLAPELTTFFLITIIFSLIAGWLFMDRFRFRRYIVPFSRKRGTVVFIVGFCILEFIVCRQVPLIHIILYGGYTDYTGIRTLHPLVMAFSSFYAQYLFYRYLLNPSEKKALIDYCIILFFIYLLQFNRGGLMIAGVMSILMFLGKNSHLFWGKSHIKNIILAGIAVIVVLFAFGALGNIRHGFSISDSSYIQKLGRFNDTYPSWLPKQFMWAYIYIITPVANLNFNVSQHLAKTNIIGYIMTFIPDFIARRVFSGEIFVPKLVVENVFNATAGFGTAYMNAGLFGMYFLYFYLMLGLSFLRTLPIRHEFIIPSLAIMNIITIFMFFTHTIYYSAISFQLVFPILTFIRLKFVGEESKEGGKELWE